MTKECRADYNRIFYSANRVLIRERRRKQYAANPKKYLQAGKRYREANPGKVKAAKRKANYGISSEDFAGFIFQQGNKCLVCKKGFSDETKASKPHVDHCHKTGKVRGLLCNNCNRGLGNFKDSPATLRRAAEYLEQTSCVEGPDLLKVKQ